MADKPVHTVAILSGGMDSTVMVYQMMKDGYKPHLLSFHYGQRHNKEIGYAGRTANALGLRQDVINLAEDRILPTLLSQSFSSLINPTVGVPEGHYEADTMKQTVVPNRNMIMLSIATGIAVAEHAELLGFGVHSGDHAIYPDCRPDFVYRFEQLARVANQGFIDSSFVVYTPWLHNTKAEIAERAIYLEMPFEDSWSCYKGGDIHCGRCSTCVERLEAINIACRRLGRNPTDVDFTEYKDTEFWKHEVNWEDR